ncbi:MAG: cobalamin-dependent protein [Ktedonobacterales bacterium]
MRAQEPRVQPPALDAYSDLPLFNTKAVVHQTGVPAPTLRAWERRYGILTPRRGENDYRLYSERDIVTVTWLRERVQTGMTISQAIALLKSLDAGRRRGRRSSRAAHTDGNGHAQAAPIIATPSRFSLVELQAALLHQMANLDEFAASRTISQTMAVYPVEEVCLNLLVPVLTEVGRLWAEGELTVTVEHFSSALVRAQLGSLFRTAGGPETGPLVLVGCAPGELHELGSLMLALFLRRAGLRVAYLGQSVECHSLVETVNALHPAAVLLSASLSVQAQALVDIGRRLHDLPGPRPFFGFGGQAFVNDPDLATQVPGTFLGRDAQEATQEVKKRLPA